MAFAIYYGASYFTEQDGTWHQTIVRDTDFTPSHIIEFYLSYPIYIITGGACFLVCKNQTSYLSARFAPAIYGCDRWSFHDSAKRWFE